MPAPTDQTCRGLQSRFPYDQFTEAYAKYAMKIYDQPLITVKEKDYIETLTTFDLYLDPFVGHKISLSGFVYRDKTIEEGKFVVGRFAVQCCTADALPYGVMVDSSDAKLYQNDE